jgi:hypothetical protein
MLSVVYIADMCDSSLREFAQVLIEKVWRTKLLKLWMSLMIVRKFIHEMILWADINKVCGFIS